MLRLFYKIIRNEIYVLFTLRCGCSCPEPIEIKFSADFQCDSPEYQISAIYVKKFETRGPTDGRPDTTISLCGKYPERTRFVHYCIKNKQTYIKLLPHNLKP